MVLSSIGWFWKILPPGIRLFIARSFKSRFTFSAAAIIRNPSGEYLLLRHLVRPFSEWGLPGGFIKRGEQADEAIRREINEEIGIQLENLSLYSVRTVGRHIEVLFIADASGSPQIRSLEITDWGWFKAANLPKEMSEAQKAMLGDIEKTFV